MFRYKNWCCNMRDVSRDNWSLPMSDLLCFVVDLKVNAPYDLLSRFFSLSFSTSGLINKRKGQSVQKLYKKGIILLFSYGVVYFLIFWHMISVFNVLQHTKQYKNRTHLWMLFSACQGQNLGKVLKHFCRFEFCFFLAFHKLRDWSIYDRDRSVWRSPWN